VTSESSHADRLEATRVATQLRSVFGFSEFRPLQEEIVAATMSGRDVLALMPTGGGKSLCYQLPALLRSGVTVVVSPLIALMKDQVDKLQALGVPADLINSSLTPGEAASRQAAVARGALKLLYVAPERLMTPGFLRLLSAAPLVGFAIDEAHCISEWGHDFRPEYRELSHLRELFPSISISAFTATATQRVQSDIVAQLRLRDPARFRGSFDRGNLFYRVTPKKDAYRRLTGYLATRRGLSGIVYCQARSTTESVAARLCADGFRAAAYHAGLDPRDRRARQEAFARDEIQIVVATIAFGMGIDKPDVRFVVHYDLPKNLEGYYQESGRAGRDGEPSDCILFYSYGDAIRQEFFIKQRSTERERAIGQAQLRQMVAWAGGSGCRRRALLKYFDENLAVEHERCCDVCQAKRSPADVTEATAPVPYVGGDDELFQRLRLLRRRLADERNLPAYVVFPDATLRQMAAELPRTAEQLRRIQGVGERKLADFGDDFLRAVAAFVEAKGGDAPSPAIVTSAAQTNPMSSRRPTSAAVRISESARTSLQLFREGQDPDGIAETRGLSRVTIAEHLSQALLVGEVLEMERLVSTAKLRAIEVAIAELGPSLLKPLKDRLGAEVSYDEIRYVQALALRKARETDKG